MRARILRPGEIGTQFEGPRERRAGAVLVAAPHVREAEMLVIHRVLRSALSPALEGSDGLRAWPFLR